MWKVVCLNYETEQSINNKEVPETNYVPVKYTSEPSSSAEVINRLSYTFTPCLCLRAILQGEPNTVHLTLTRHTHFLYSFLLRA